LELLKLHAVWAVGRPHGAWGPLRAGENNDSSSTFIDKLDEPIAPRYPKSAVLDKLPDDGQRGRSPELISMR
jgi:hypothetical protein